MGQKGFEKTLEEILRERAEVLFRASEKLSDALRELAAIDFTIGQMMTGGKAGLPCSHRDINAHIAKYNDAREYAKLRYFYLIVTREAMGFRRHTWVDEVYRIPPKKKTLKDFHGQVPEPAPENG